MNKYIGPYEVKYLNDPRRSRKGHDVCPLNSPQRVPYEAQKKNGVNVFYSLLFSESNHFAGYRLTLVFANSNSFNIEIKPKIELRDASGFLIPSYTYQAFVDEIATLARSHSLTQDSDQKYKKPASFDSANHAYETGFEKGFAQGVSHRAKSYWDESKLMLRWANAYWLKSSYGLTSLTLAAGVLYFPAMQLGKLPLSLVVETGIETFDFSTIADR